MGDKQTPRVPRDPDAVLARSAQVIEQLSKNALEAARNAGRARQELDSLLTDLARERRDLMESKMTLTKEQQQAMETELAELRAKVQSTQAAPAAAPTPDGMPNAAEIAQALAMARMLAPQIKPVMAEILPIPTATEIAAAVKKEVAASFEPGKFLEAGIKELAKPVKDAKSGDFIRLDDETAKRIHRPCLGVNWQTGLVVLGGVTVGALGTLAIQWALSPGEASADLEGVDSPQLAAVR